jgi:ribosomal protein S18 acetylase RimI-like enzyme
LSDPAPIRLIRHGRLALRLRWRLGALQALLDGHSFWARGRQRQELSAMLGGSQAVVSAWQGQELVGFGRASSDGLFRAVLWDVVVDKDHQGRGLGRRIESGVEDREKAARADPARQQDHGPSGEFTCRHQSLRFDAPEASRRFLTCQTYLTYRRPQ